MEVPTKQEFDELKREVQTLREILSRISAARSNIDWVTVEVTATILSCSQRTVWRLIKNNQLTVLRHGKKVRIGLDSIRAYLRHHKYEPAAVEARINSWLAA